MRENEENFFAPSSSVDSAAEAWDDDAVFADPIAEAPDAPASDRDAVAPSVEAIGDGPCDSDDSINEAMDEVSAVAAVDGLFETDEVDRLAVDHFPGKIVRKDLTALMKRGANVPTFVLEYLLGMYCSTSDPVAVEAGLERIRGILLNNYVRPDESEVIKSKIRELGSYTVIDKVSARLDERNDNYVASFTNLRIEPFVMPAEYVRQFTKILQGGIWCIMRIQYTHPVDDDFADIFDEPTPKKKEKSRGAQDSPFSVISLNPIQMPNLDLDSMIDQRRHFTTEQWQELLLRSAGYEPTALTEKERMHFLERMVPLIERNYNLCELGPRGTGKSHIYKEISPYAILLSGGQTTTANLFGRMNARGESRLGLVGLWDCVTFDEVAGMNFKDANAVQIMKDYMASGSYARGRDTLNADASIVMEGNINDSVQNVLKTTHLFDPFPPEFNDDSAFFDRIHYYLPGWEIPKMRSNLLTEHYGLITDCLSEFCKEMRRKDFTHLIDRYFRLNSDFNKRDEIAVRKTFSGLAKLLFPDGEMTKDDVRWILEYAIEGRRRVKEQLKIMAGVEFIDVALGYYDADDPADVRVVPVPEQSDDSLVPDAPLLPGHVFAIGHSVVTGECAIYKLENRAVAGEFKLQTEGLGRSRAVQEAFKAAFNYFENNAARVAPGMHIGVKDYLLFFNDLQGKGPSDEVSLAEFVGLCSAAANRPVAPALVIPGVLRMSGTMGDLRDLEDILRVARNAGARRILLPMSSIRDLQDISSELIGAVSPDFYPDGDAVSAAKKALEL
ncbi:protease Lon-related BREX system protein BrxL [Adlercreutzia sp. R7]|uniref:Protease Lon-related BREX system protein BrxL n=1 Tax=Adlercreutzia wanghongyangiae TaxID=3111451 RepID=A0ABU6IGK4_9ACTN|nr:protease Lon-related BREX system protein BrxL [Adlercreutzia sp. R7]